MPPHQLDHVDVKGSAGGEGESLIPVYQRPLIVWSEQTAIAHLACHLTIADERIAYTGFIREKVYEPISTRDSY